MKEVGGVSVAGTLIAGLKTLFCLNRWNVRPRLETWTEAENVALCCHLVYAVGRQIQLEDEILQHAIKRTLFKSIYKYKLTDISVSIREEIQKRRDEVWRQIRQDVDNQIKSLFPASVASDLYKYFSLAGEYGVDQEEKALIEDLVKYAKYWVALAECETNARVFPENYADDLNELRTKRAEVLNQGRLGAFKDKIEQSQADLGKYLFLIGNLKHVRRWNRLNRTIESSVLAHTFIVAFLAVLFSEVEKAYFSKEEKGNSLYCCMLRALFHDVPEVYTGDIITPVKRLMKQYDPELLPEIEAEMTARILAGLPLEMRQDVEEKELLEEPTKDRPFSGPSLVRDCDTLAGMLECAFEISVGNDNAEIVGSFSDYYSTLQNSEWNIVREFSNRLKYELEARLF